MPGGKKQRLETVRQIARRLGVEMHHVTYLIEARGIEPASRVGNIRQFDDAAITTIEDELGRIAERREVTR